MGPPPERASSPPALPRDPDGPLDLFLALVQIASPSGSEGAVAGAIAGWLADVAPDVAVSRDGADALTGSDTGNLVARRRLAADRPTVLMIAHLDTVQAPGDRVVPVVGEDGVVRSAGETILGADNKSAVAALLWLLAHPRPEHANLVAVFTTTEERGVMGVSALGDLARGIDLAFPVDGSSPVGTVLEAALGQLPFRLVVRGRRAHAAKDPEQGVHAVAAAAEILAGLELGWSGRGAGAPAGAGASVLNISRIEGGSETNLVPDRAVLVGEVRAFSEQVLRARLGEVIAAGDTVCAQRGTSFELIEAPEDGAPPFPSQPDSMCLTVAVEAMTSVGVTLHRETCMATLEANFLAGMGIPVLGIASGGQGPHSVDESLEVAELERLCAVLDAVLERAASVPM
ncbi:MAG TPA: M20/M25/M40 family metallo-hydrolase [Solirubrobacteraceae bacterium]|nr:M20/M25/M40 family metallo-hydrolase [Solirubrobacteraceae bacterium]